MSEKNATPQRRRKGTSSVTMSDVAKHAGVSPQTVSRVLGKPMLVSKSTQEAVLAAVRELNYIPNAAARDLASSVSRTIAVVIPSLSSPAFASQVAKMIKIFEKQGISVVIGNSEYSMDREEDIVASLLERRPQGIMVTGLLHSERTRFLLEASGIPVVETWETDGEPINASIGFSNYDVGRDVGRLLIERGSKRVGYVGGSFEMDSRGEKRFLGLKKSLNDAGLEPVACINLDIPLSSDDGIKGLDLVLNKEPMVDAIFFASDQIALPALLECKRRGIQVPEQIAICGFSNYDLGSFVTPSLTTVDIATDEIGSAIAQFLLDQMNGVNDAPSQQVIGHRIVRRASA